MSYITTRIKFDMDTDFSYRYVLEDLLEFPQKYQMSQFEGNDFIFTYKKSRRDVLTRIENSINVLTYENILKELENFNISNKQKKNEIVTGELFSTILLEFEKDDKIQEIEKFLKKFEIRKRIFSVYDNMLKNNSSDYREMKNYILLGMICAKQFEKSNNLKFLNTLLKLNDTICSRIHLVSNIYDLSLIHYSIKLELYHVEKIIQKVLK